jgi:carbon monoxide dehydrogenase subunit G
VWSVLLDPAVLARVLPGIEKFEETAPDRYSVVVELGVAAVKGRYAGTIEIFDRNEPESYRLRGDGKGGPGWAKGEAVMSLADEGGGTRVRASANVQVGGTVAGVGQRMMDGIAKSIAKEFFASFAREVAAREPRPVTGESEHA